jgi:dolichol-phosphate mannosyltransferase
MSDQTTQLKLLSVVIPARDEEGCIASTAEHLDVELRLHNIPHEIVVVDDGSTDRTWQLLQETRSRISSLTPVQNPGLHGFGRSVARGFKDATGDAAVVMMADESDDCRDVVWYWDVLNQAFDCVFGSRFIKGGGVMAYHWLNLRIDRIRLLFKIKLNNTTNAFKAYQREVIDGCQPFLSPYFNLTVEIPSKQSFRATRGRSFRLQSEPPKRGSVAQDQGDGEQVFLSARISGWRILSAAATM